MSLDIPYGWAGCLMINADSDDVERWAHEIIFRDHKNLIITNYGPNLCKAIVRKPQDLTLFVLRWS
jgi:hypothetical protein